MLQETISAPWNQIGPIRHIGAINPLCRQAVARNLFHYIAEPIQLAQRGIDVWRNTNALKLFVNDRRREDAMLIK